MSNIIENRAREESSEPEQQPVTAATDRATTPAGAPSQPGEDERRASSWRAFRDPLLIGLLVAALVADQVTKQLVLNSLGLGTSWPDDGFFRFTFVRNNGTAFGLFRDNGVLLTVISLGAVALIIFFYREAAMASWFTRAALGLQLGGAAGNLIDRFRHGYVVDFIDVGPWPIFNIADSAIITGIVALIAYFTILGGRDRPLGARTVTVDGNSGPPGDAAVPDAAADVPPPHPSTESPVSPPEPRD